VLDFGLAKIVRTIAGGVDNEALTLMHLTDEGTVLGTPFYMSPEQTGERLWIRVQIFYLDVYSTRQPRVSLPFSGPSVLAVMHGNRHHRSTSPSRVRPELPREIRSDLERALAKDKERRYSCRRGNRPGVKESRRTLSGQWSALPSFF